jgi:class 3 adenylate cyclase/tetratricopeptide (TPR) repeat protein
MSEERRTAVVLFAQAVGLADLPEADRAAAADALFRRFRATIERQGGTVDKFLGDEVMAVFGAPVAHEEDAVRAARAALALGRDAAAVNAERGLALAVRAGINVGEVLWGRVGGEAPTAMGDVVNVAQRLKESAERGAIVASRSVARAAAGRVKFREIEALRLRGRQEAVAAFLVEGERAGQTEFRRVSAIATPMVGRNRELDRILGMVERGRGGYFVVEGEAGIGKSRLLHELRRRIREANPAAWIGVGRAREGPPLPLGALGEIVRGEFGDDPTPHLAREMAAAGALESENRASLIALSLGYALPGARVTGIEPARILQETRHAWECWVRARAARGAVVLCVEDLHWADGGTVALMSHFAARLPGLPVYVVASARPGAKLPSGHDRVALGELPAEALARLAEGVLPGPLAPELVEFLVQKAGGNPYYVEELARHLVEEKLVSGSPARLSALPSRIPGTLHALLVARLDSVGDETRDALKAAAVVGRAFWRGHLSQLLDRPAEPFIAEAHARQMVFPRDESLLPGDAEHVFKHALLRDAAYSLLPRKERLRLHLRAAETLPVASGRRVAVLAAGHFEAAGRADDAAQLWLAAGGEALRACAWEEADDAASHAERLGAGAPAALLAAQAAHSTARYDEALSSAARAVGAGGTTRARARLLEARVHQALGRPARALEIADQVLAEGAEAIERAGAHGRRADALEDLGRFEEALAAAHEGIAVAAGNLPLLAGLEGMASRAHAHLGRTDEARCASDRSLAAARAAGDRRALSHALGQRGSLEFNVGAWEAAEAAQRQALDMAIETGDRKGIANGHSGIAGVAYRRGAWDEALRHYEEARRIHAEVGDPSAAAIAAGNAANVHFQRGDSSAALAGYEECLRIRRESGQRGYMAVALVNVGAAHGSLGQFDAAMRAFEEALSLARELGNRPHTALALVNISILHHLADRFDAALAAAREAGEIRRALGDLPGAAEATAAAANARQSLGDMEGAGREHAEALEMRRRAGAPLGVAESLSNLGEWRRRRGDFAGARRDLEEAADVCRRLGQRRVLAQVLRALSETLAASGSPDSALVHALESLSLNRAVGDRRGALHSLSTAARIHAGEGRRAEAASLVREAAALAREQNLPELEAEFLKSLAELDGK